MTNTNDGGPAFPRPGQEVNFGDGWLPAHDGMTLRDWFAGTDQLADFNDVNMPIALAEVLAGRPYPRPDIDGAPTPDERLAMLQWSMDWRATLRYMRADAMLRAREAGR